MDITLPNFKRTTFYRLLKEIGFKYEKRGNKGILVERVDIIVLRHSYLRKMKRYRAENKNVFFLDKKWVNVAHSVTKAWREFNLIFN